ncbi:hypothetical protein ACP70R_046927 [Stipagrostis hirtigluma subsp. patula]
MAMEAHKLRFVRCPRCLQLLVEYPSIPVYQCGACGTVLRAKNRVVPAAQSVSESDEHSSFPNSLKGSPQNNKLICPDEQKVISYSDRPGEDVVDANISSTIKNRNSGQSTIQETRMPVAQSVIPAENQNEEACSLIDGNVQKPGVMIKEVHDKGTGANSGSSLIEEVENLDSSEDANGCKLDNVDMREVSTLYEKTEVLQTEERLHTYEGMHVESHEALIEELERSLSFSSDDEDLSDEAENSGLSDALRHQMGSRRFMLGGKMNDAARSDPHGRLIEELEMSFSDVEEPTEQIAAVADRVHKNEQDKNPQSLGAESVHPCEESISSFDNVHLKSEQTFHQEKRLMDNGNQGKEDIADSSTAKYIHENEHIVIANEDIAETLQEKEHSKDWQSMDVESVHLCEGRISLVDDGNIGLKQSFQPNDLTADGNQEKKESCTEDGNITNDICVHENENLVISDENSADRVNRKEVLTADGIEESDESHMEDDNKANYVHANENVAVVDKDISEKVDEKEHGQDQQSLEAEKTNLRQVSISSLNVGDMKSKQSFRNNELTADDTEEKEEDSMKASSTTNYVQEDGMENGNTTNYFEVDSAAVASFSSLPDKRTRCKLPSFNKSKEEMPCRYRASQLCQGLSLDSEDFKSIQNIIEAQKVGASSSVSSGSPNQGDLVYSTSNKFNNVVRFERLKKMDELRDQLSRLSSQKGSERSYGKRDLEYQQQPSSYDVEQHLQSVDADSIPSSCALESYYGYGKPPRYHPSNSFSPSHTYTQYHFGHAQTHIPHSYDAWEFDSYYQSSYTDSRILDNELLKPSYKEKKRAVRKHILRPLSGASPFTICNSCFNLVQTPSDIYISKAKIGKMQCGQCSKVLVLSFPAVYHAEASISKDAAQLSNKPDAAVVTKNEDATSHSAEYIRYPVSVNEEYGASFRISFSTRAESSLVATQSGKKVSDSALHRLMGYDSASQLLRDSRVFENGYDSFESMVPVSSRVSRRKKM